MKTSEKISLKKTWTIEKYASGKDFEEGNSYEKSIFHENVLLNEGITEVLNLIGGISGTAWSNANATLGVGNAEAPTVITGNVTFTNGSATVTGTSLDTQLAVGDIIKLDADGLYREVLTVDSATQVTLTAAYTGTGGTGAGSKISAAVATSTDLLGTTKTYQAVAASYPQVSGQTISWQAVFGDTVANHEWNEFTVSNGADGTAVNLNRKVSGQGSKSSGTWTLTLDITLS